MSPNCITMRKKGSIPKATVYHMYGISATNSHYGAPIHGD